MAKKLLTIGEIRNGFPILPQKDRKKVLLLCDDLRLPSGVGTMAKEFVTGTCHHFNWCSIAGAIKHPEQGKVVNISQSLTDETGVPDCYANLYPTEGYGSQQLLRTVMEIEKPDMILHFTDPRFWIWLYQMEHEIRRKIPIAYLNIWDNLPFATWNKPYYKSCDLLMGISKLTYAQNKYVLGEQNVIEAHKTEQFINDIRYIKNKELNNE
jgi:hypothetical protein